MKLSDKLAEMLCSIRGHELMREGGGFHCAHCPMMTANVDLYLVPLSAGERQELYEFLLDQEMGLTGGG